MIFLERLALVQQLHARHAPAATRLDAVDVDVENLAGAGKQGEMRGDRVPPGVLRQHRAAAAIAAQDQRTAVEGAEHRSEEHTSELQSLMRISSAVFCLKKKTKHTTLQADTCRLSSSQK